MYECAICHSKVKIPSLLYLAVPEVKDKGLTIEYKLINHNICKKCAKELLGSMFDDEAEMSEPMPICEPEVPWIDDDTLPNFAEPPKE